MIVDFSKMEEKVLPNFMGGEGALRANLRVDEAGKILHGILDPGCSIGMHTHESGYEVIYILKGEGKVIYDGEELPLSAGMCHYCPNGHTHSLINNSGAVLEFFAVVPLK